MKAATKLYAFATQGSQGDDEARLRVLLSRLKVEFLPFDHDRKFRSFFSVFQALWREKPGLVVMEGTGIAGGVALLLGKWILGVHYVFSSGDAVGPFVASRFPSLGPFFSFYEKLLIRFSSGFIGWSPYLTGRALTYGAPRAMTACGWAPFSRTSTELSSARQWVRREIGIPEDADVIGIVGSLAWNSRLKYCYGLELVLAIRKVRRRDLHVLIVGDGSGKAKLAEFAGSELGTRIHLTGRVPRDQVPAYLSVMDLASLPQSLDGVGNFRYTTKLSEYLACGVPVVTGQIPMSYDLPGEWFFRLPGGSPWDPVYVKAMAELLEGVSHQDLLKKKSGIPDRLFLFEKELQVARVSEFISELTPGALSSNE